ncbi:hypothetical protein [Verminephrobacter aporrectodeae]|uniref:hypothetical protein n=1 Tax=Verminephrobacter aporrectodeae TaxID=1110389 RepID=UPI001110DE80|nr:hypothetical protein [Verminephrobacter aporrectodeae]
MNTIDIKVDLTYGTEEEASQKYGKLIGTFDSEKQEYVKFVITFNADLDAFSSLYDQLVAIQVMYDKKTTPIVESKNNDWLKNPITIYGCDLSKGTYVVSVSSVKGTAVVDSDEFVL